MTIVSAFASSHTALMISRKDAADPARQQEIYDAFRGMGERMLADAVDVVVVIGTDHGRRFGLDHVPGFTIGVGEEATGLGDGGLPPVTYPVDREFAADLLHEAIAADIDLAFSEDVRIDHSFVAPLLLAFGEHRPAIVPLTQNCGFPPQPALRRSFAVGRVLGGVAQRSSRRVSVIGTGGLSHWVGSEERRELMRRPPGTRYAELSQHPLYVGESGPVNEEFDRRFLDLAAEGRWEEIIGWAPSWIEDEAGNGAQEIRNWITAAGFADGAALAPSCYAAMPEWLTGIAVAEFEMSEGQDSSAVAGHRSPEATKN